MSEMIVKRESLQSVADKIKAKAGTTGELVFPEDFEDAVDSISGGSSDGGWIGDGNTHIWISLVEGRTRPMLGVAANGTVTVDWGDGSEPDTLTGTSTSTRLYTPAHEYEGAGDYVITLFVEGEAAIFGVNALSFFLSDKGTSNLSWVYRLSIKKVEVGNGMSVGDQAFINCASIEKVVLSSTCTSVGRQSFQGCLSMENIVIPEGVTSVGRNAFMEIRRLTAIEFPASVINIESSAFNLCYAVCYYDFSQHSSIPALESNNAFGSIAADCAIRVPAALYDEWIAATNWTSLASNIVAV